MPSRLTLLLCLGLAACSFDTSGIANPGDDDAPTIDANVAPDACVPTTETCEGTDEDCDGLIDEGFTSGAACDGPDTDQCPDDMTVCDENGAEVCGDTSGDDDTELCNTTGDEDCDGQFDEDFNVPDPCDGGDDDLCPEGNFACAGDGTEECTDTTGNSVEICNVTGDEDCDGQFDEDFNLQNDELNCGACGNTCTNQHGSTQCQGGNCDPTCDNGAAECDPDPDNGCELVDTNPACLAASTSPDATVTGDAAGTDTVTGTTEAFLRIRITESVVGDADLTARIALTSGTGTDFDLFVYCTTCAATPITDTDDAVEVGRDDANGPRDYEVIAEVRYDPNTPSTTCAAWTVTVTGGVATANRCAN